MSNTNRSYRTKKSTFFSYKRNVPMEQNQSSPIKAIAPQIKISHFFKVGGLNKYLIDLIY